MRKALLVGFTLSAAVFAVVVVAGPSSAEMDGKTYADNSVVNQGAGLAVSGQGT